MIEIEIEDGDITAAIESGLRVKASFGPSGMFVKYDSSKPLTPLIKFLLMRKGILNQNLEGAGI